MQQRNTCKGNTNRKQEYVMAVQKRKREDEVRKKNIRRRKIGGRSDRKKDQDEMIHSFIFNDSNDNGVNWVRQN